MTLKGGTSQACAACRFQRKKCTSECPLAPYFPADQQKMFQNAHRLFGVSNMVNILKEIDPSQKAEAMHSIICQANIRETYPVHGCCWVIRQLSLHIQQAEEELHAIRSQLAIYRSTSAPDSAQMPPPASVLPHFQPQAYLTAAGALPNAGGPYDLLLDNIVVNPAWAQYDSDACSNNNNTNNNNGNANNPMSLQAQLMASDPLAAIQQVPAQEYDEMHTFFDTIDDRQSYIDSKEAYDSSSESSLKDTTQSIEHVAEDELKSAAACFSLTSVN